LKNIPNSRTHAIEVWTDWQSRSKLTESDILFFGDQGVIDLPFLSDFPSVMLRYQLYLNECTYHNTF